MGGGGTIPPTIHSPIIECVTIDKKYVRPGEIYLTIDRSLKEGGYDEFWIEQIVLVNANAIRIEFGVFTPDGRFVNRMMSHYGYSGKTYVPPIGSRVYDTNKKDVVILNKIPIIYSTNIPSSGPIAVKIIPIQMNDSGDYWDVSNTQIVGLKWCDGADPTTKQKNAVIRVISCNLFNVCDIPYLEQYPLNITLLDNLVFMFIWGLPTPSISDTGEESLNGYRICGGNCHALLGMISEQMIFLDNHDLIGNDFFDDSILWILPYIDTRIVKNMNGAFNLCKWISVGNLPLRNGFLQFGFDDGEDDYGFNLWTTLDLTDSFIYFYFNPNDRETLRIKIGKEFDLVNCTNMFKGSNIAYVPMFKFTKSSTNVTGNNMFREMDTNYNFTIDTSSDLFKQVTSSVGMFASSKITNIVNGDVTTKVAFELPRSVDVGYMFYMTQFSSNGDLLYWFAADEAKEAICLFRDSNLRKLPYLSLYRCEDFTYGFAHIPIVDQAYSTSYSFSNLKIAAGMFEDCYYLTNQMNPKYRTDGSIYSYTPLSFDMPNVENLDLMFNECRQFHSFPVFEQMKAGKSFAFCKTARDMFSSCDNLSDEIQLGNDDPSDPWWRPFIFTPRVFPKLQDAFRMFAFCYKAHLADWSPESIGSFEYLQNVTQIFDSVGLQATMEDRKQQVHINIGNSSHPISEVEIHGMLGYNSIVTKDGDGTYYGIILNIYGKPICTTNPDNTCIAKSIDGYTTKLNIQESGVIKFYRCIILNLHANQYATSSELTTFADTQKSISGLMLTNVSEN